MRTKLLLGLVFLLLVSSIAASGKAVHAKGVVVNCNQIDHTTRCTKTPTGTPVPPSATPTLTDTPTISASATPTQTDIPTPTTPTDTPTPTPPLSSWSLHTRVTQTVWLALQPYHREGDLFTGLGVDGIPISERGYMIADLATLQNALDHGLDLSQYRAINLDGEYADYNQAISDAVQIRRIADEHNVEFVAFYNLRIIDARPTIVQYPDIVVVGNAFWNRSNMAQKATPYVNLIRAVGRTPGIYIGDLNPCGGGAWCRKTQEEVDADIVSILDLGVHVISYFYDGEDTRLLIGALQGR